MAVPQVSHRNWWLTKANAEIANGTTAVDSRDMGFDTCLKPLILDESKYSDHIEQIEEYDRTTFDHDQWDGDVTVAREYGDRERPHRPTVSDDTIDAFEELVANDWPSVAVDDLPFDEKLTLLLKRRHQWLEALDNYFFIENLSTGERAELKVGPTYILD